MSVLYYVHDPMCSWCWGYQPAWKKLRASLPAEVHVHNVLGGLAADTEHEMPAATREAIQGYWKEIQGLLGTEFNFDFWTHCRPRRDTYKACRAVIVAAGQGLEEEMITAIQRGYYLRAMNPSEPDTLVELAGEIGLDREQFHAGLFDPQTEEAFQQQLALTRQLGVRSFPSLVMERDGVRISVAVNYQDPAETLEFILTRRTGAG